MYPKNTSVRWIEDFVRERKEQKVAECEAAASNAKKAAYRRMDSALTVDRPNAAKGKRGSFFSSALRSSFLSTPSRTWKGGIHVDGEEGVLSKYSAKVGQIALTLAVGVAIGAAVSTRSTR